MRFPSISNLVRACYTLSNAARRATPGRSIHHAPPRATVVRSMPNIPFLGALFGSNAGKMAEDKEYPGYKSGEQWRAQLSREQFHILREKGTERPGTGKYDKHYPSEGIYTCVGCTKPLYKANHKFDSGCGWPAFWDAVPGAVGQRPDGSRTEIVCNNCGCHLGHIFKGERFGNPKDERHCVNSISLNFSPEDKEV